MPFIVTYVLTLLSDVSRRIPVHKDGIEGIYKRSNHGRTTRTEENAELAENGFSDEGRPAAERAQTARSMACGKHLRAHPRSAQRQAALCFARRTALSHGRNPPRNRAE